MVFREQRFNSWTQGEVYILCDNLIPNARRDDFEQNAEYDAFIKGLTSSLGDAVTNKIREASKTRNNPSAKVVTEVQRKISTARGILGEGFNSTYEKAKVLEHLEESKSELSALPKKFIEPIREQYGELISSIDELTEEIQDSANYKLKKVVPANYSKKEKRIIQAIMEVLSRNFERGVVETLRDEFLEELENGGE